jgi:virulence factor
MRVAMIGLGDIARKAYLPTLTSHPDVTLVLVTRDRDRLAAVAAQHRIADVHTSVGDAIAAGLDAAFVHVATEAHATVLGELLRHRIPTYVDKPLAYDLRTSQELAELAARQKVSLTVGFNRRYAPAYRELLSWPRRDVVLMQKNRVGLPDDIRRVVLDDFIHVVDTLRFLGPPTGALAVTAVAAADRLDSLTVHISDGRAVAIGVMNRVAGLTEEVLEVLGPSRKRRVVNVAETTDFAGAECITRREEWTPVAVQRGFQQICAEFIADVRAGQVRSAADALATHAMCEEIVQRIEQRAG